MNSSKPCDRKQSTTAQRVNNGINREVVCSLVSADATALASEPSRVDASFLSMYHTAIPDAAEGVEVSTYEDLAFQPLLHVVVEPHLHLVACLQVLEDDILYRRSESDTVEHETKEASRASR